MKGFFKKWIIETIWIIGNIILILKYFIDKCTIRCEPCIDINNCPPCQTDFMRDFWIYTTIFNLLIIIGLIVNKTK
jgi:hypothetical protein